MGVTHVVRGEDHVTNTGLQLQMFEALGAPPPAFAHEALLTGSEGKLSKRLGSLGVEAMREAGIEPAALVAKLARIGTSLPVEPFADPAPLIESFDFASFGRAPARFDMDELAALNARIVHQLDFAAVARSPARRAWPRRTGRRSGPTSGPSPRPPTGGTSSTAMSSSAAAPEDRDFLAAAAEAAEAIDWSESPWPQLVARLKETQRPHRQGALPPAAPRAHRPRQRPRNGGPAAADRPRREPRPPPRRRRLKPSIFSSDAREQNGIVYHYDIMYHAIAGAIGPCRHERRGEASCTRMAFSSSSSAAARPASPSSSRSMPPCFGALILAGSTQFLQQPPIRTDHRGHHHPARPADARSRRSSPSAQPAAGCIGTTGPPATRPMTTVATTVASDPGRPPSPIRAAADRRSRPRSAARSAAAGAPRGPARSALRPRLQPPYPAPEQRAERSGVVRIRLTIGAERPGDRGRAGVGDQRRLLARHRAAGARPLALPPGHARRPAGRRASR